MKKLSKKAVNDKLLEVMDPELNISIVDLGLIYKIEIKQNNNLKITMTLTTVGCPLFSTIEQEIKDKLKELGVKDKNLELILTFDPPWTMDLMSKRAKAMLGI